MCKIGNQSRDASFIASCRWIFPKIKSDLQAEKGSAGIQAKCAAKAIAS